MGKGCHLRLLPSNTIENLFLFKCTCVYVPNPDHTDYVYSAKEVKLRPVLHPKEQIGSHSHFSKLAVSFQSRLCGLMGQKSLSAGVLRLRGKILVAGRLQRWLLLEAAGSFP